MSDHPRVIVVGGGLAGLAATVRIAEQGVPVDLFSMVPVKRSHSVCAQGGINACNEVARQQGYSEWQHMDETLYGGDFLNHQPPVYEMTHWAPKIIDLLDRMGVPFNRTQEGFRDLRLFGGSLFKRTHFSGASTGQQLLYALDEQTRRYEADNKVNKYEFWEFLWPILDDNGVCKGIIAQDQRTMEMKAFRADAVVMATGGCGIVYGKSTMSVICTGAAAARCYKAGAWLANAEMIQVHPTAIPGEDKCRLMSESARGEGGRVWVPKKKGDTRKAVDIPENERWYFLEERYPKYGNLVPRDIATREIFSVCEEGYGVGGGRMAYLDITHLPMETKDKLAAILEIYEKFTGDDPRFVPMKIFPAVHYTMGGLWTEYTKEERNPVPGDKLDKIWGMEDGAPNNMMTNIQGLYAFGEVNYQYHGATRLGANALLSCIFDGLFCGSSVANYVKNCEDKAADKPQSLFDGYLAQEQAKIDNLTNTKGKYNPYEIHARLGDEMTASCTVVKNEPRMTKCYEALNEMKEQYKSLGLSDTGTWTNQNIAFARALGDMMTYAEAILLSSLERKESRGSHYRSDFTERIDDPYHKTSICKYDAATDKPVLEWEDVPLPMVELRKRDYSK
ncbi:succinate dehydrogenase flavoprotein subunit [Poriferisphaera sp. WC338]|uniref:succinate dehydrogenase flavoprotein subunit n=1 Tax=Poriferisphaera sp. WC338 TaxID=3425129 RepID=UPI003D81B554